ncbi:synaptogenesis protein syg-2-like, partial [Centruroides sculpturatus]|uniref:synaptogenesis protein syg-2-like n=1 Tax=Centruroides sculpturatus TaxID=218467 RepID=UPI000C6EF562
NIKNGEKYLRVKIKFLLGFERNIPGYPRYFMVVNAIQGVYNLRIESVRLEDEAEFQCQVGPSENQKPIRAAARLTVVIPPKDITINGLPDGEEVMVRESQRLVLTCKTRRSKPPVEMKWYRRSVELVPEATKISVILDEGRGFTTSSSLTLYPKLEQSGTTYTCEAFHSALEKPLRATIAVGVLYPPSPPIIQGYEDDDVVQVDDMVVLICISRGGKPAPRIIWYRNDILIDMTHSSTGYETTNTYTFTAGIEDNNAVYRCEVSNALTKEPLKKSVTIRVLFGPMNLTISGPSEANRGDTITLNCKSEFSNPPAQISWVVDNNIVRSSETDTYQTAEGWVTSSNLSISINRQDITTKIISCYASAIPLRAPIAKTHTVVIKYPPESPTILGYDEISILREGDLQHLTCVALGGNPPANLKWYKEDREKLMKLGMHWTKTLKKLTLKTKNLGSLKEFVVDPPESPTILGYDEISILREGDLQHLTCVALGGNPPANLKWYKEDREVSAPVSVSGSGVSSELVFHVDASDNGITYTCKALSPAITQALQTSVTLTVTLICQTGASNPKLGITWLRNNKIEEEYYTEILNASFGGVSVKSGIVFVARHSDDGVHFSCKAKSDFFPDVIEVTLICQTGASNPKLGITWLRNNKIEEEYYTEILNASFGGVSVKSGIVFVARHSDDGVHFSCKAKSDFFPDVIEANTVLRVLYKPRFTNIVQKTDLIEGESIKIKLTAYGNPDIILYNWYKEGATVPIKLNENRLMKYDSSLYRVTFLESMLLINNVSRHDSSIYTCEARNEEGSSNATVILNVRYAATVTNISKPLQAKEGDNVNVECSFDGNPLPENAISWMKDGVPFIQYKIQGKRSYIKITNVSRAQSGEYSCVVDNGIGKASIQTTSLSVMYRPVIRRSQMKSKVASDLKDTAKFRCISDSYSNTSISWSYKQLILERSPKYEVRNSVKNSTWESTLLVKQLEESDFGIYDCIAINALGKDVFQFLLVKRGPPETPLDLQVVNVTNNYIFIMWKAGFDGGSIPSFRIRYRQSGTERYFFQDAIAMKHHHKITSLKSGIEYIIAVSAWNDLGHSNFSSEVKVTTTDIPVMDSTVAVRVKKDKKTTATSGWWWICFAAVGTALVMVNLIVVICLIHRGKCCTRSIGGHQCTHIINKQAGYTLGEKSFYMSEDKLDSSHEHILLEKLEAKNRKSYMTVEMIDDKLTMDSETWSDTGDQSKSLTRKSSNRCFKSIDRTPNFPCVNHPLLGLSVYRQILELL